MFIDPISNEYSNSEIDRSRVNLKMENKVSKSEIENKVSEIATELTLMRNTSGVLYFVPDFDSVLASNQNLYQRVLVEGVFA